MPSYQSPLRGTKSPYGIELKPESHDSLDQVEQNLFQKKIKTSDGKSSLVWLQASDKVSQMKQNIMQNLGYPSHQQNPICGGRSLQDDRSLHEYNILPATTIILNLRLRGKAAGSSKSKGAGGVVGSSLPKGTELNKEHINGGLSFKDILQGEPTTIANPEQTHNTPHPYIVE